MRYINTFKSMTDFNEDKQTNLNQPRVALVKENGEFDKNLKSSDFNTMKSYNILRKVDMISTIKSFR